MSSSISRGILAAVLLAVTSPHASADEPSNDASAETQATDDSAAPAGEEPQSQPVDADALTLPLAVSLFPPLQFLPSRHLHVFGANLNVIYVKSEDVHGFDVGMVSFVKRRFDGVQVQALVGMAGTAHGIQICGLVCGSDRGWGIVAGGLIAGSLKYTGVIVGGLISFVEKGRVIQAGSINFADRLEGAQIGVFNNTVRAFTGIQIGLINLVNVEIKSLPTVSQSSVTIGNTEYTYTTSTGESRTLHYKGMNHGLFLGLANAADGVTGLQGGAFNLATVIIGGQLGVFNKSTAVHGVQVGLVNVTRSLRGLQLGVLNIATANRLPVMIGANAGW